MEGERVREREREGDRERERERVREREREGDRERERGREGRRARCLGYKWPAVSGLSVMCVGSAPSVTPR